jgi:hypothetical protein
LRSEELQDALRRPSVLIKSALRALRANKRVRTDGSSRWTRYYVVPKE